MSILGSGVGVEERPSQNGTSRAGHGETICALPEAEVGEFDAEIVGLIQPSPEGNPAPRTKVIVEFLVA